MKICVECEHCKKPLFDNSFLLNKCKLYKETNPITGKIKFVQCLIKNRDGKCADYTPKESK